MELSVSFWPIYYVLIVSDITFHNMQLSKLIGDEEPILVLGFELSLESLR